MIFQYNPYGQPGQGQAGAYGAQTPFGNNQQAGPKKLSIPTWLFWLLIIGFLGFAGWLVWFMYFK